MLDDLKTKIHANTFVDDVRCESRVDEANYAELCALLKDLARAWKDESSIDKELALTLYCIPQMIWNAFRAQVEHLGPSDSANRLEEMWIELDALVLECLRVHSDDQATE